MTLQHTMMEISSSSDLEKLKGMKNKRCIFRNCSIWSVFLGNILMSKFCSSFVLVGSGCFNSKKSHMNQIACYLNRRPTSLDSNKLYDQWNEDDDWSSLSSENKAVDSFSIYNKDVLLDAANEMTKSAISDEYAKSDNYNDDEYLVDVIDSIHMEFLEPNTPALYDTVKYEDFETHVHSQSFWDEVGNEISLLVRCNESPHELLISEGRALPLLTEEELYDFHQLVNIHTHTNNSDEDPKSARIQLEPTAYFQNAIAQIFLAHAKKRKTSDVNNSTEMIMDSSAIASWLSTCLREKIGRFDKRVIQILSKHGKYKSGVLTRENLQSLYLKSVGQELLHPVRRTILKEKTQKRLSVWNDLIRHDIDPPVLNERKKLQAEIDKVTGSSRSIDVPQKLSSSLFMDECEIVWGENWEENKNHKETDVLSENKQNDGHHFVTNHENSPVIQKTQQSHKLVELLDSLSHSNMDIPKRIRDGSFVFVDEESCIGCKQVCIGSIYDFPGTVNI